MKVYKYGDNVDTDVIIPARYLNAPPMKSPWPPTVWRTSTPASPPPWSRATSSWLGPTSAAAPPGSTPPGHQGLRRQVRHRALLRPHLLPQRHQHRLSHSGVRRGGGGHSGRRHGERGLRYRRDHRRDHRQDLSGRAPARLRPGHRGQRRPAQIPEGERCGEMNFKIALIRGDGIGPEVVGGGRQGAGGRRPEVRPQLHL